MRFYIETYGCTANFGNSQQAKADLMQMGHMPSGLKEADVVIINTCAVTERTERKILRRLRQLQGSRLIIAGCLSAALPGSLENIACLKRMGILGRSGAQEIASLFQVAPPIQHQCDKNLCLQPEACGIVNIAEGCVGSCSYCIVNKARGELVSRRPEEILEEVQKLVATGVVEIQLAAQDTAAYGLDIETSLPHLLDILSRVPGNFMIRVGMMNPDTAQPILKELACALNHSNIYKFLHMPLQSGSDEVLRRMGRRYSADDFARTVQHLRRSVEGLTLITDVIAGFPGESDCDFQQTMDLIESLQPDKVNVTRFSQRPGTAAARLYDMPDRIKKDRSRELTRLWQEIAEMRNIRLLGSTVAAQVTEMGKDDAVMARTENYREIVVHRSLDLGGVHRFKIVETCPFYLEGEIVSRE